MISRRNGGSRLSRAGKGLPLFIREERPHDSNDTYLPAGGARGIECPANRYTRRAPCRLDLKSKGRDQARRNVTGAGSCVVTGEVAKRHEHGARLAAKHPDAIDMGGKGLLSFFTTSDEIKAERAANVFPTLGSFRIDEERSTEKRWHARCGWVDSQRGAMPPILLRS